MFVRQPHDYVPADQAAERRHKSEILQLLQFTINNCAGKISETCIFLQVAILQPNAITIYKAEIWHVDAILD